jgi:hypothetical protein
MMSDRPKVRLPHGDSTNLIQESEASNPGLRETLTLKFGNSPEIRADNDK